MTRHHNRPDIPRRGDGSPRPIYVASEQVRLEQAALLNDMSRAEVERFMPYAHGGIKGRSPLTNATVHIDGRLFYKLDLWCAYEGVDHVYLRDMASVALAYLTDVQPAEVGLTVDRLVLRKGVQGLPTGYATSPMFYNVYCMGMDNELGAFCAENGLTYTRYIDDLVFSSPEGRLSSKALRRALRARITAQPGAVINDRKGRVEHIDRGVTVTGIALTSDPEYLHPAKELLNAVDACMTEIEEKLLRYEEVSEAEIEQLHGYNSVLHMAGPPEDSKSAYVRSLYARYRVIVLNLQ